MYADVTISVAMLQDVYANEGSDMVAVVDYSKMWTMVGTFLAAGDQVCTRALYFEVESSRRIKFGIHRNLVSPLSMNRSIYLELCTQPVMRVIDEVGVLDGVDL